MTSMSKCLTRWATLTLGLAISLAAAFTSQGSVIVPTVAHANGAYGSVWRTDISVYNPNSDGINIRIIGTPRGQEGSSSDPGIDRMILPGETQLLEDAYSLLHGTAEGVDRWTIFVSSRLVPGATEPTIQARTYNSLGERAEFGAVVPTFNPVDGYFGKDRTFVAFLSKAGTRDTPIFSTPPVGLQGATTDYGAIISAQVRTAAGHVVSQVQYTIGPDGTYQLAPDMPELLGGEPKPDGGLLEITVLKGALRAILSSNNNATSDPSIAPFTEVQNRALLTPQILGLDLQNDGVIDISVHHTTGLDGFSQTIVAGCDPARYFRAWLVVKGGKPPYEFQAINFPTGMTVDAAGMLEWKPPCSETGKFAIFGVYAVDQQDPPKQSPTVAGNAEVH